MNLLNFYLLGSMEVILCLLGSIYYGNNAVKWFQNFFKPFHVNQLSNRSVINETK